MPENYMSKEELVTLVVEENKKAVALAGQQWTETIEKTLGERIQEALKNFDTKKRTPFGDGQEDPKGGFVNFAEFAKAVYDAGEGMTHPNTKLKGWMDKSMVIAKAAGTPSQSVGSLEAGGALIPPEYSRTALTKAMERSTILPKTMKIPMNSNVIEIPFLNDFDNSQGKVAGNVQFKWVAENAGAEGSQLKFKTVELKLREANALIFVSKRLMDFSPASIEPFITVATDNALDLALSDAFINGTGGGQPLGILNAACLVEVAIEEAQLADSLVYENTLKMLARFYGKIKEWYANSDIIPQLGVMTVESGTAGVAVFLGANNSATGAFGASLHGAPLNYEQCIPTLGDKGDLILCDWSQYLVGQFAGREGLEMTESAHLKFDYRQNAFQFTFYIDGQPWWPDVYRPRKGNSKSPFVCIAERA